MRLYLVTSNEHKYQEAKKILEDLDILFLKAPIGKFEIQADSLRTVAWSAALHAYKILREAVVVDDSGLFIEALKGFPGVYSNYVFRTLGIEGILKLMRNVEDRRACFKTALAAIVPPLDVVLEGEVCGTITSEPLGKGGFGFDPIFVPEGERRTFAQMSVDEKNKYSHRARAFRLFARWLKENFKL